LQQFFRFLPGIYFVAKNREGEVMMANVFACRACGFQEEAEMLGKTDHELFSREQADAYVRDDEEVFRTGSPLIEKVELAPDPANAINWMVTTKIPLFAEDGRVVGIACMARGRDEAHERLRPYTEFDEVLEYVRTHYAESIQVADLAKVAGRSPSSFARRFKSVFGTTPARYILQVRIKAACSLLTSSDATIATIAQDVGFYDHSHFIRVFSEVMGVSPRVYRNRSAAHSEI
jgi:AraC-like DNA-binding protein